MPSEVSNGKSPAIQFLDRVWNDESKGVFIKINPPSKVCMETNPIKNNCIFRHCFWARPFVFE